MIQILQPGPPISRRGGIRELVLYLQVTGLMMAGNVRKLVVARFVSAGFCCIIIITDSPLRILP